MLIRELQYDIETMLSNDVAGKAIRCDMTPPSAAPDAGFHRYGSGAGTSGSS